MKQPLIRQTTKSNDIHSVFLIIIVPHSKICLKAKSISIINQSLFYNVNTMQFEEKNCQGCRYRHTCEEVYNKLGHSKACPVTLKIILAFLLPLIVFIASIALFERIFSRALNAEWLVLILSLFTAVSITLVLASVVKKLYNKFNKAP